MNEEAENLSMGIPNNCQLNGGSFVTVPSSSATSLLSSACFKIIAELVAIMHHNSWPCFFALDQSV